MAIEHLLPIEERNALPWQRYLLDSLLAILGTLLVTGVIYAPYCGVAFWFRIGFSGMPGRH